jgi:hypothetical protein
MHSTDLKEIVEDVANTDTRVSTEKTTINPITLRAREI